MSIKAKTLSLIAVLFSAAALANSHLPQLGYPVAYSGGGGITVGPSVLGSWSSGSTTTGTAGLGTLPSVGASELVLVNAYDAGNPYTLTGVADNQGNCSGAYTKIWQVFDHADGQDLELWWCPAITTASGTFTVTATLSGATQLLVKLITVNGISAVDQETTSAPGGDGTTVTVTAPSANAHAADFVLAAMTLQYNGTSPALVHPATTTNTETYTDFGYDAGFTPYVVSDAGYYISTAIETSNATWTWTGSIAAAAGIATFH